MKKNTDENKPSKNIDNQVKNKNTDWFLTIAAVLLAVLFFYLPFDHGGFYAHSRAFLAILTCFFLSFKIIFPTGEKYPKELIISSAVFFSLILISVIFSTDIHNSSLEFIYMLTCGIGFIMGYYIIKRKELFPKIVYLMIINLGITCFFGILTFIIQKGGEARAFGRFFQADILGGFIVMFIPLVIMLSFTGKNWIESGVALFLSSVSVATLVLTFSRGALLSFLMVLPFVIWYGIKFSNISKVVVKLVLIFILATGIVMGASQISGRKNIAQEQIKQRIEETRVAGKGDGSSRARLNFYGAAIKIALEKPLTGTGPGTFGYHFPRFQKSIKFFSKYPHNYYLWILSQSGFLALFSFLVLLFFIGKTISKRIKSIDSSDSWTKPLTFALAMGLISSLLHINLDVDFHFAGITFVFFGITGILAGIGQEEPMTGKRKPPERILRILTAVVITTLMFPPLLHYFSFNLQKMGGKAGNKIEAYEKFKKAVAIDPFDNEARRKLGQFYHDQGKDREALEQFNTAIKLSPTRARNYDQRGRVLEALGKREAAFADFQKAVSLDPFNQLYAYFGMGMYYLSKGNKSKAMEIFHRAVKIYDNVKMEEIWHFRADQLKPQVALIYVTMGDISINDKKYKESLAYYQKAAEYDESAAVLFGLGFSYFNNGDWQNALDSFHKLLKVEDYDLPYYYISECYKNLGDKAKAEKYMKKYDRLHRIILEKIKREQGQ